MYNGDYADIESTDWKKYSKWREDIKQRLENTNADTKFLKFLMPIIQKFANSVSHGEQSPEHMDHIVANMKNYIPDFIKRANGNPSAWQHYTDLSGDRPFRNFSEEDMKTAHYLLTGEKLPDSHFM